MNLLEKIDILMEQRSLNKRQLAIKSKIPYTTLDGLYNGRYENMKIQTFKSLCTYFGVTMDSMAYDDREIEYTADRDLSISADDAAHIRKYRAIDDDSRQMVDAVLDTAYKQVAPAGVHASAS